MWKPNTTIPRHLLALLPLALLFACGGEPPSPEFENVALTLDGEPIPYPLFESYTRDVLDDLKDVDETVLSRLLDQFLDEQALARLAVERGLTAAAAKDHGMVVDHLLDTTSPPTSWDEDIMQYYAAHRADFERPESVRLQQILTHDRDAAEDARRALLKGEDMAEVSARFSQVPDTDLTGGRLGRDDLPPAFAEEIFALEPGEISEVFAAEYGFHVFRVLERYPAESPPMEAVADEIRRMLERRHGDQLLDRFLEEARQRYDVRVHTTNLPFAYRGAYAQPSES